MTRAEAIKTIRLACLFDTGITPKEVDEAIASLPIKCKECKWWDEWHKECHSPNWDDEEEWFRTPPNMFCGWAEGKEK